MTAGSFPSAAPGRKKSKDSISLSSNKKVAHPAINAVLTTILARAQKQGIKVEHEVSAPETLPFPDTELCTVLMNLLQNALDANALAPAGAEKWLRVSIHIRGRELPVSRSRQKEVKRQYIAFIK